MFDASHQLALEDELSKAKSFHMDGFGRNPHWEDAEMVSAVLHDFFRDHYCLTASSAGMHRF
ncbi:hypothetical protein AB4Z52_35330 [Rhizobium sp. 2YAF20]|uniref:hypothetical protein n=1 Tax=Rhizobium sp. 2YAF20 TaxID=3233027 RepID=UPI003F9D83AE